MISYKRTTGYFDPNKIKVPPEEIIVKEANRESGKEVKKKGRKKKDV